MRGPEYRGFSADGDKTLFQLAGRLPTSSAAVMRLVVCEAPIDAMSLAGIERLRTDTLYVSTAGGMGPHTIAALQALLRDMATKPGSILVAATDADTAGEHYASQLMELATAAGVQSGRILPFGGHKDWNQVVVARRQALGALPSAPAAERLRA